MDIVWWVWTAVFGVVCCLALTLARNHIPALPFLSVLCWAIIQVEFAVNLDTVAVPSHISDGASHRLNGGFHIVPVHQTHVPRVHPSVCVKRKFNQGLLSIVAILTIATSVGVEKTARPFRLGLPGYGSSRC